MTPCGTESQVTNQNANLTMNNQPKSNTANSGSTLRLQQIDGLGQAYKLIIQIDKIRARPGPKSKKRELMTITYNNYKKLNPCNKIQKKNFDESVSNKIDEVKIVNSQSSCVSSKADSPIIQEDVVAKKNFQCAICQQYFVSTRLLNVHEKTHWMCKFCDKQCDTKLSYDNHQKIHIDPNSQFSYKCNLCPKAFEDKDSLRVHSEISHKEETPTVAKKPDLTSNDLDKTVEKPVINKQTYTCGLCKIDLKNDESLRIHVAKHKAEIRTLNGNIPTNTSPEVNSKSNHERNILKYACKLCSKEFSTTLEAEIHAYGHADIIEPEYECNICKKLFKTEKMLDNHLAHHLSRAHHCVICRKAFINRTTLKIHMKTHKNII